MTSLAEQIKHDICNNNAFCLHQGPIPGTDYATDYYSEAIRRLIEIDPTFKQETSDIARSFQYIEFLRLITNPDSVMQHEHTLCQNTRHGKVEIVLNIDTGVTTMLMSFER